MPGEAVVNSASHYLQAGGTSSATRRTRPTLPATQRSLGSDPRASCPRRCTSWCPHTSPWMKNARRAALRLTITGRTKHRMPAPRSGGAGPTPGGGRCGALSRLHPVAAAAEAGTRDLQSSKGSARTQSRALANDPSVHASLPRARGNGDLKVPNLRRCPARSPCYTKTSESCCLCCQGNQPRRSEQPMQRRTAWDFIPT